MCLQLFDEMVFGGKCGLIVHIALFFWRLKQKLSAFLPIKPTNRKLSRLIYQAQSCSNHVRDFFALHFYFLNKNVKCFTFNASNIKKVIYLKEISKLIRLTLEKTFYSLFKKRNCCQVR